MAASAEKMDKEGRWVIAAGCFFVNLCSLGFQRGAASVFFVYFIEDFHITREEAAWPTGLCIFFAGISAILSGHLTQYWSIRSIIVMSTLFSSGVICLCSVANNIGQINILYGVLQGIGLGPVATLTQVIVVNNFVSHRSKAMGIGMAGVSVGSIIGPRVTHWLIEEYGMKGTFLLVGAIALNSLVGISLLKDSEFGGTTPSKVQRTNSKENHDTNSIDLEENTLTKEEREKPLEEMNWLNRMFPHTLQVLSNFNFCMITLVYAITYSTFRTYFLIAVDLAEERLIPPEKSVFLLSVCSFTDLAGRLTIGWIVDKKWLKLKTIVLLLMSFDGLLMIVVKFCYNYESLMSVFAILGFVYGSIIINQPPMIAEYLDRQFIPLAFGISAFFGGFLIFLQPLIVGFFKDRTHSYDMVFVCFGVVQIASVGVWILASAIRKLMQNKGFLQ